MNPFGSQPQSVVASGTTQAVVSSETALEVVATPKGLEAFQPGSLLDGSKRQRARDLAHGLNLGDSDAVAKFGIDAQQRNVDRVVDPMLARTLNKDAGVAGDLLNALITQSTAMVADPGNGNAISRFIRGQVDRAKVFRERYTPVSQEIARIQGELQAHERTLASNIRFFDELFNMNAQLREELMVYIYAGKLAGDRARVALEAKKREAQANPSNYELAQEVLELQSQLDSIERKTFELYQAYHVSIQNGPQIRLIQQSDKILREMLSGSIFTVIPIWKTKVAIAIGIADQQRAFQAQRDVNAVTTKLIVETARMAKNTSVEIARASGTTIDMAALEEANQLIISAVTETVAAYEQARAERDVNEAKLQRQQQDLVAVLGQVPNAPQIGATSS